MFGNIDENQQNDSQTQTQDNPVASYDSNAAGQDQTQNSETVYSPTPTDYSSTAVATQPADNPAPGAPAYEEPADDFIPPASPTSPSTSAPVAAASDDLLELKQKALQDLTPLVNKLDLTAEEKFRTTMMMIQASDNKALLPDAYTAAQTITDEKARAQALLDVINEINYFTQNLNQ